MEEAVIVVGLVAEATAWWFVAFRGRDVWRVMTPVLAAMGVAAISAGPPAWSPEVEPAVAVGAGFGAGVALYAATRAFVLVARPWRVFRRHAVGLYRRQGELSLAGALVLSVALTVPGEEVFWRGFVQPELAKTMDAWVAALLGWAAFVAANAPSRNLAVLASAVVGGAVWGALGWWSGGALAPLVCHAAWTALMLSFPVVRRSVVA
ncbi:MAG: lysostaphin resistance A-like protein [Actinomycetota bacterium]